MKNKYGVVLFLSLIFIGCAANKNIKQPAVQSPPKEPAAQPQEISSPVQILWDRPAVPFMILGRVYATAPENTNDESVYLALQKQAEKMFAHAIVIQREGIQVVREGDKIFKKAMAWAITFTNHAPIHQMPGTESEEDEEQAEQNIPSGFGLLP